VADDLNHKTDLVSGEEQVKPEAQSQETLIKSETKSQSKRATPVRRSFPPNTLEESLAIIRTLKDFNGGNPWTGEQIAKVLKRGSKASDFYYLTASSRDYGLTEGTSRQSSISITELGREYLFAQSAAAEREALQRAFFAIPIFKEVYEYFHGSNLPDMKYLQNTLEGTFKLEPSFHEEFYQIYLANCRFLDGIAPSQVKSDGASNGVVGSEPGITAITVVGLTRAFVIMPFTEKTGVYSVGFYREVYANLICPAAKEAGFEVYTARKQGSEIIHSTIINDLLEAELVIADLTEHNPNVLFELGFRMAEDKPVALIRAKGTAPIFDVDNLLRVWDYNPNLWKSTLEEDIPALIEHLKGTWGSRNSNRTYKKILSGKVH